MRIKTIPHCSFWATVCKTFRLCYRTVVCPELSCLSVTFVHCGQTVGWIKMKLGMQVGLVPGHIVLDEWMNVLYSPTWKTQWQAASKGQSPLRLADGAPIFGPYLLQPNGWMDQDATWYGGRPQPRRLCVRWGSRSTLPKNGGTAPPQFSAPFYCGQTAAIPLHASRCRLVSR